MAVTRIYQEDFSVIVQETTGDDTSAKVIGRADARFDPGLTETDNITITDVRNNRSWSITLSELRNQTDGTYATKELARQYLSGFIGGFNEGGGNGEGLTNRIEVTQLNYIDVLSNIDESKEYFFVEPVTFSQSIRLNENITINSFGTAIARIIAGGAFPLFFSDPNESKNIFLNNIAFDNSFVGSTVFDISGETGFETLEYNNVNFINSEGLGEINGYRQILYNSVAYIGGKPSCTLSGANFGGVRTSLFNGINLSDSMTEPVFKAGAGLVFNSTFDAEGKIDLGSTAPFFDFSPSNFLNDENLIINDFTVLRNGIQDATDNTITPNIDETSVKSLWSGNTGLRNTTKKATMRVVTEQNTVVTTQNTYFDLLATWSPITESHFSVSTDGIIELLSGNGEYSIFGSLNIAGNANQNIDVRIVKSENQGPFNTVVFHRRNVINSLIGPIDRAFYTISGDVNLKKGDRIKMQVEIIDDTGTLVVENDSDFTIKR